jgi:hypothetical protein
LKDQVTGIQNALAVLDHLESALVSDGVIVVEGQEGEAWGFEVLFLIQRDLSVCGDGYAQEYAAENCATPVHVSALRLVNRLQFISFRRVVGQRVR